MSRAAGGCIGFRPADLMDSHCEPSARQLLRRFLEPKMGSKQLMEPNVSR